MTNPSDDDWRLNGQEQYLLDAQKMTRAEYSPPSPDWDHDHCEFCWAKFMDADLPDVQRAEFKTDAGDYWVCDAYFAVFKTRFRWTVKS